MTRRRPTIPLALLAVVLGACPPCLSACGAKPNGKDQVLFIHPEYFIVAENAIFTIEIPDADSAGGSGKIPGPDVRFYSYDFSGTTLEASAEGIEILSTTFDDKGYLLTARCLAPALETTELSVKVKAGNSVRYADRADLHCARPSRITIESTVIHDDYLDGMRRPVTKVGVGAEVFLTYKMFGTFQGSEVELRGRGMEVADPGTGPFAPAAEQPDRSNEIKLDAERPGSTGRLILGEISTAIPVSVHADSEWVLRLEIINDRYTVPPFIRATALGYLVGTGVEVLGLRDCEFTLLAWDGGTTGPGSGFTDHKQRDIAYGSPVPEPDCMFVMTRSPDAGMVCVTRKSDRSCNVFFQ